MSSYKTGYKAKGSVQSPKYAEKKRKQKTAVIFLSALCLVTLAASAIMLLRSSFFEVKSITVKGPADLPTLAIESKAKEVLAAHAQEKVWYLFPRTSTFFVPKEKIGNVITSMFPEVNTVSVKRSGFSGLTLSVQERVPIAIVCFGFLDDSSTSADGNTNAPNCYYSDRHGFIFASISSSTPLSSFTHVSGGASLPTFATLDSYSYYYVPTDKGTSPLGTTFVDEKRFRELENFANGAHSGGLSPLGILVGENGEYEIYIKNKKEDSEATVYFDDKVPFDATLSNLLTFWNNPLSSKKPPVATTTPPTGAFDYINLRFGNTVYYSTH